MPLVNGGPVGPDGLGGAYKNTDSSDRAALWQSLGARQGILTGGALATPAGALTMEVAAFRAVVAERDASGVALDRGYHAWADTTTTVVFNAPSASSRVDALVLAVADTSAGSGAFGSGVTEAGPQLLIVTGASGVLVPRTDTEIQSWVGSGGWVRLADVQIDPADTEVNDANVTAAASSAAPARAKIEKTGQQTIPNNADTQVTYATLTFENRDGMGDAANNRIVIPTGEDGGYRIATQLRFSATDAGERAIRVDINGTPVAGNACTGMSSPVGNFLNVVVEVDNLVAGDLITVRAFQDSGAGLQTSTDADASWLSAVRIR